MKAQNIFSIIIFLISIFNIQSICFASQKHNGICEFLVANEDKDDAYRYAGTTFMTKKMNEIWTTRGNLDLNERFMVAPRHLEMNEKKIRDRVFKHDFERTSHNVYKAIKDETFRFFKARCGNIEFKINRIDLASKQLRQGLLSFEETSKHKTSSECERNEESKKVHDDEERLLKKGCDLTVYKIDKSSIIVKNPINNLDDLNGEEATLDNIIGFDPTYRLKSFNELQNIFLATQDGKLVKCPVEKSLSSSIVASCEGKDYNSTLQLLNENKLPSGTLIFGEDPRFNNAFISNDGKRPSSIGVLTRRRCYEDLKACEIEIDLIQVSSDLIDVVNPTKRPDQIASLK